MERTVIIYGDELYHHGVRGQKWGVRNYQNEDGSYKPGAEGRYYNPNPSTRRELRAKNRSDIKELKSQNKGILKRLSRNYIESKSAIKSGNASIYYKNKEANAKTNFGKKYYSAASFNSKAYSDYYKTRAKDNNTKAWLRANVVDPAYMKMPVQRLSGRQTTRGRQALDMALTGGMAGWALDRIYSRTGKDYGTAIANRATKKYKQKTRKIRRNIDSFLNDMD